MKGQISIFDLLEMDVTQEIPFEDQKEGVKGWVIEIGAVLLTRNGYRKNMLGVTTYRVILKRDSHTDRDGFRWQSAWAIEDMTKGCGWSGRPKKLYAKRPTWGELQRYARDHAKEYFESPDFDIVFTMKGGDACTRICDFDTRKPMSRERQLGGTA